MYQLLLVEDGPDVMKVDAKTTTSDNDSFTSSAVDSSSLTHKYINLSIPKHVYDPENNVDSPCGTLPVEEWLHLP